jgi:hypothetical protein
MTRTGALAGVLVVIASVAAAAPLGPAELRARTSGAEFRGYFLNGGFFENHIWRMAPDGSIRATYTRSRGGSQQTGYSESGEDAGRWTIAGNSLCVQFTVLLGAQRHCYVVDAGSGSQVRLQGPQFLEGTLSH